MSNRTSGGQTELSLLSNSTAPSRREFLRYTSTALPGIGLAATTLGAQAEEGSFPPVRQITSGPKHHWFGYYDKLQFCPANRFVLSNQVDFEHRSPTESDTIQVGMVDTQHDDEWIELGQTDAWCWQQGCMLQWLPTSPNEVIWNDRDADQFVARILNTETGSKRTIPSPVYNVAPDGKTAVTTDFARLNDCRPGYGYAGLVDANREIAAPEDSGVWLVDLETGERRMLMSLADVTRIPFEGDEKLKFTDSSKHWFNHLLFNTDGSRIWMLHRWTVGRGWATRAITINPDGSDPFVLDPYGRTSHFIWRDPRHVMAWAWHPSNGYKFYLYEDKTDNVRPVGADVMTKNGHNTYLPMSDNEWVLNDTYPDRERMQHPYLYHIPTNRRVSLGDFHSPPQYRGEWRCDTHPRSSRDGRRVCIDSPHEQGRQLYLIDVSAIVG